MLGAGADRAAALAQVLPLAVAVDEDPTLVENAVQEERGTFLDPIQMGDIHPATGNVPKASGEAESGGCAIASERHEQIQVRVLILVAPRQ